MNTVGRPRVAKPERTDVQRALTRVHALAVSQSYDATEAWRVSDFDAAVRKRISSQQCAIVLEVLRAASAENSPLAAVIDYVVQLANKESDMADLRYREYLPYESYVALAAHEALLDIYTVLAEERDRPAE